MTESKQVAMPTNQQGQEAIDAYARSVGRVSGA
jgi:hypothetical protein